MDQLVIDEPWLQDGTTKLVVKPDQLIKRRGKAGLVGINLNFSQVTEWINARMKKDIQIEQATGELNHFIIEPFVSHESSDEYYVCIQSDRTGEELLFCNQGGVDVGDVDAKAERAHIKIDADISSEHVLNESNLLNGVPAERKEVIAKFIITLFRVYRLLNFTYMEINPIVVTKEGYVVPLDLAAKIDETAAFLNSTQWGHLDFPAPFGRKEYPEEAFIRI